MGELSAPVVRANSGLAGMARAITADAPPTAAPARVAPTVLERVSVTPRRPDLSPAAAVTPPGAEERYQAALAAYKAEYKTWTDNVSEPWWKATSDNRATRNALPLSQIGDGPWTTDAHPPIYKGTPAPRRADFGLPPEPT